MRDFDQKRYWQSRVSGDINLGVVGYRSLGKGFNEYIYRRRLDVLDEIVSKINRPCSELRVLDIGCGSGFYVNYWQKLGVRSLTGVDVSSESITLMQKEYPGFSFAAIDATIPGAFCSLGKSYDIVTVFDVIYHVIDDLQAAKLLVNALEAVAEDGSLLLTDTLGINNYGFVKHVRFRGNEFYDSICLEYQFQIIKKELLFNFLQPPILRQKKADFVISGLYYMAGKFFKLNDSIGRFFGRLLYYVDKQLFQIGIRVPNQELLVFMRNS